MKFELQGLLQALAERSVRPPLGTSIEAIAEYEGKVGLNLPPWLSALYLVHDGIPDAMPRDATHDIDEMYVLPIERAAALSAGLSALGVFAIAEEDSDVLAQIVDGALQGYVVKIPHDGEMGPLFRDEREYLRELSALLRRGRSALRDLVPSCGGRRSSVDDQAKASALVTREASLPSTARRSFQLQIAACLLGSHQTEEFLTVLDDEDRYVRESAEDALRLLADAPARQLLDTYASHCKQFETRCKRLVESSGRTLVEMTQRTISATWAAIRVRGASGKLHWLPLAGLYGRRTDPSFDAWFCERVRELR